MDARRGWRWGLGAALCFLSLMAISLHARVLMAHGYLRYAKEQLSYDRWGADGLVAADWAVRLSPYPTRALAIRAALRQSAGDLDGALADSRTALKYGSNDPYLWQAHVQLKVGLGQMDDELTTALQRIEALAPGSFWLQRQNAVVGITHWNWGRADHRQLWAHSVGFVLQTNPHGLLRDVLANREVELLCREFKGQAAVLKFWCPRALKAREMCQTRPRQPGTAAWCRKVGLAPLALGAE